MRLSVLFATSHLNIQLWKKNDCKFPVTIDLKAPMRSRKRVKASRRTWDVLRPCLAGELSEAPFENDSGHLSEGIVKTCP